MKRRSLLAAGGAFLVPSAGRAQAVPLVGVLRVNPRSTETFADIFRRDMTRLGWEDGKSYRSEFLFGDGDADRLPALAAELVARQPRVIATFGNQGVEAVQRATRDIPIVGLSDDLVAAGLVASMARPGGNTTGVSIMGHELEVKRLEVLHEIAPQARRIGVVMDQSAAIKGTVERLEQAATTIGVALSVVRATTADEVAPALAALAAARVEAVQILASAFLNAHR